MARYNKQLIETIATLIEDGAHSVSDICNTVGISRKTYYKWKELHPEFADKLLVAENRRVENLREQAQLVLRRKLDGYTQRTERTIYVPSADDPSQLVIKQHVVTEKFCEPDTRFLMQLLGNEAKTSRKEPAPSTSFAVAVGEERAKKELDGFDNNIISSVSTGRSLDEDTQTAVSPTEKQVGRLLSDGGCEIETVETIKNTENQIEETPLEKKLREMYEYKKKHEAMFVPPPLRGIRYRLP